MVETLDGTKNEWGFPKAKLGANAVLAVSLAYARASAADVIMKKYLSKLSPFTNTWLR
jgi:enolase